MLKRTGGYLTSRNPDSATPAALELEQQGFTILRRALEGDAIQSLRDEINRVFDEYPRDNRPGEKRSESDDEMFRYEMLNRSALCQACVSHQAILDTIEPLLGQDCHVIANTAWRNPASQPGFHGGQAWHIDAGPHIPLPEGVSWPKEIPHPVFAVGVHVYLQDCRLADGPTGVIPGSHLSGRFPPRDQLLDEQLAYDRNQVVPIIATAGDIAFFVSDVWHRRLPTRDDDQGRFFLQIHYGRRDIAQRIHSSKQTNQLSPEAISRAVTDRDKTILGLHKPMFYDG